jgi:hypothetical protein
MGLRIMRIYGGLDLAFAFVYLFAFIYVVPPYSAGLRMFFAALSGYMVLTGFLLLLGQRWGRYLGLALGAFLIVMTFTLVAMLLAAAAYLKGVYGAFGQGSTYATLVGVAVVLEAFGLLGAFQVRAMLRPELKALQPS